MTVLQDLLGKPVSPFAFGVMQFGGKADAGASRALYDMAREAGITLFDAAYIYADGKSETLLGEFAEAERDQIILISKCGYDLSLTATQIRDQIEVSRERLRTDKIDLLYLHRYPGDDRLDMSLEVIAEMYGADAFSAFGVSNFAAWQVMRAKARAAAIGAPPISVLQPMYNLVKRQAEVEILPMAMSEGLAVHSYSPLGGGLLSGKYATGETGRLSHDKTYARRYEAEWMHKAAEGLTALAAELGVAPATLAAAWVAAHPGITAPILSASRTEQFEASLAAIRFEMTDEIYSRLSALSPTPPPATDRTEEARA